MKHQDIKKLAAVINDCLTQVEAAAGAGEWELADIQLGITAYFSDNPSEVIKNHLHLTNAVEIFASKEFGWCFADNGDAVEWLNGMRDMIVDEIKSILDGTCTSETYGFKNQDEFLKNDRRLVAKIDTVLGN